MSVVKGRMSVMNDQVNAEDNHEGYLEKQSPTLFKMMQKRYFVLSNKLLKYFKTK